VSIIRAPRLALHEQTRGGDDDRIDAYNVGSNGPEAGPRLDAIFPAIADYAFLSDCENNCLISPTGAVEWLCLPRPHDPSVFGTILDRSAGSFRLGPTDTAVPASRRYLPGTNILESTWQTRTGWLVVQDFLAVGPWHRTTDRSSLHRRTPGDFDAQHVLVRYATCLYGAVDITLDCEPAFDYGRTDANWEYTGPSYEQVRRRLRIIRSSSSSAIFGSVSRDGPCAPATTSTKASRASWRSAGPTGHLQTPSKRRPRHCAKPHASGGNG